MKYITCFLLLFSTGYSYDFIQSEPKTAEIPVPAVSPTVIPTTVDITTETLLQALEDSDVEESELAVPRVQLTQIVDTCPTGMCPLTTPVASACDAVQAPACDAVQASACDEVREEATNCYETWSSYPGATYYGYSCGYSSVMGSCYSTSYQQRMSGRSCCIKFRRCR